ncbi:MAG TPA: hypothetical protein VHG28_11580 [Longimicrobiaceae bacterium]|nr:hypothetical protein [Longimicrobiaceae bacterium]
MTIDEKAFVDRLYADALAADLRMPDAFVRARTHTSWDSIEARLRERAEVYRQELSATPAAAQSAIEAAKARWCEVVGDGNSVRVARLLACAARRLLQADGREMILRVDRDEPGREILRWRFVSLALPLGILVVAATRRGSPPPAAVRLLHPPMAPDVPVAQQHVHYAAMMSFEELWASLRLRALLHPADLLKSLREERAYCPQLHGGRCLGGRTDEEKERGKKRSLERARHMGEWCDLIQQAFIARHVLDRHAYHAGPLSSCSDRECMEGAIRLRHFTSGRSRLGYSAAAYPWPGERYSLQRQVRKATEPAGWGRGDGRRHKLLSKLAAEERDILMRAFEHLCVAETEPPDRTADDIDPLYERLFLQYLRIKTAVFGLLVHPPGERGLKSFVDHFKQIKVYAPESALLRPAVHMEPGLRIRAVERRVAPDAWPTACERWDREDGARLASPSEQEKAWLVHFQRSGHRKGALPLFGDAIRQMNADADRMIRALAAQPRRLNTLRGIDVAGVEVDQPLWVSAETLRHVRARSSEIAGRRPGLKLQPLRLTLHTGEDFDWLTSGVRAVAEPFHWKLIERGDRVGHGIAITLDPKDWWKRKEGQVFEVKMFDRLLDLAFLAEYTDRDRGEEQSKWLAHQIEMIIKELGLQVKLDGTCATDTDLIETAKEVWRALGDRTMRRLAAGFDQCGDVQKPHEKWLQHYLWNRSTQKRAHETIWMKVDDDRGGLRIASQRTERDLLVKARRRLIREVARWQVCIESNPSSNLIVGGLDAMGAAQDFLQRRPTRHDHREAETLTWTISTDDPITFSTTLADEYAYAWAGMVLREGNLYDPAYARALLEEAAATSMRMRFTIPPTDRERKGRDSRKRRGNARSD